MSARGCLQVFSRLSCRAGECASLVFLCRLAQSFLQLAVDDYWLHVPFTRALACFRVPDVGTMLVDNVEAFSFVQNFRNVLDCCSVSGSTVVKLEACQRSTVCTPLHRHDRHRCISHLEVDLSVRTAGSQRCTTHTAQWQLSSSATISILMQNTCTSKQLNPRNNNWTITRCLHTPSCSKSRCFSSECSCT